MSRPSSPCFSHSNTNREQYLWWHSVLHILLPSFYNSHFDIPQDSPQQLPNSVHPSDVASLASYVCRSLSRVRLTTFPIQKQFVLDITNVCLCLCLSYATRKSHYLSTELCCLTAGGVGGINFEQKCVFSFPPQFWSERYVIIRRIHRHILINYPRSSRKKGKGKGKVHRCTGTEALYRPYGP